MKGHGNIIELRLHGKTPGIVFLNAYPCQTDWFDFGEHATVCTSGDDLSLLDLRFLVGLRVSISATSETRARGLSGLAKANGAATVAACHIKPGILDWKQDGWTEIWHREVTNA